MGHTGSGRYSDSASLDSCRAHDGHAGFIHWLHAAALAACADSAVHSWRPALRNVDPPPRSRSAGVSRAARSRSARARRAAGAVRAGTARIGPSRVPESSYHDRWRSCLEADRQTTAIDRVPRSGLGDCRCAAPHAFATTGTIHNIAC